MSNEPRLLEHWGVAWQPKRWLKSLTPPVSVRAASRALAVSDTIIHNWDTANFTPLACYKALLLQFHPGTRPPKQLPKFVRTDLAFRLSRATWELARRFDDRFGDTGLPATPTEFPDTLPDRPERAPRERRPLAAPVPVEPDGTLPPAVELQALVQVLAKVVSERDQLQLRVAELERDLEQLTRPAPVATPPSVVVPTAAIAVPDGLPKRQPSLATRLRALRGAGLVLHASTRAEREWRKLEPDVAEAYWRVIERLGTGQPVQRKVLEGDFGFGERVWSARASVKHRLLYQQDGNRVTLEAFASRGDKEFYRHE